MIDLLAFQTLIEMAVAVTFTCLQTLLISGIVEQTDDETQDYHDGPVHSCATTTESYHVTPMHAKYTAVDL
jgi:hypothetical protein